MELSVKHNIIIPSTHGVNTKADTSEILKVKLYVAEQLSKLCGGCTISENEGYYVADSGELVIEQTTEIYTIGKAENITQDQTILGELAEYVRNELKQECVLIYSHPCEMELV